MADEFPLFCYISFVSGNGISHVWNVFACTIMNFGDSGS